MKRISIILLSAATSLAMGCGGEGTSDGDGDDQTGDDMPGGDEWDRELEKREYDYNAALRIAALRLKGDLPTMEEINRVALAGDLAAQKSEYELLVRDYMSRPSFARQMMYFWRDTFKMGGSAMLDTAPAFAAKLTVDNGNFHDLFKATSGACPTFDEAAGTFAAADCAGAGPKVGVLSNQGVNAHWYGNFAFRRVKWVQETFACTKFPINLTGAPIDDGGITPYVGDYPPNGVAGTANGGRVNFVEAAAVRCEHCHKDLNRIAPLFANFDMNGVYQPQIAVRTPLQGEPLAVATDYLPAGVPFAWRMGVETPDLTALGAAIASDPAVAECNVARIWNWAFGRQDIVDSVVEVPTETIQTQVEAFTSSGFKMKDLIFAVYTADDFVKF